MAMETAVCGHTITDPATSEDEVTLYGPYRDVFFFDPGQIDLHDKCILGFVEVELGLPLLGFGPQPRSPRAIDEFVKEAIHLLGELDRE
jgi:hypothetical protein